MRNIDSRRQLEAEKLKKRAIHLEERIKECRIDRDLYYKYCGVKSDVLIKKVQQQEKMLREIKERLEDYNNMINESKNV